MATYLKQSKIEMFVKAYLSKLRKTNNLRKERPFIDKAKKIINTFRTKPCCEDDDFSVDFASRDNALTLFLWANLTEAFDLRKYRKSLIRTETLLTNALEDPCCD